MSDFIALPIETVLQNRYRLTTDEDELDTQAAGTSVVAARHVLGRGGQGAVYLALHTNLKRYVAVKQTLLGGDANSIYALEREAQLLAGLKYHRALPQVYEFFEERGSHFLVMEFVRGENLLEMMQRAGGKLPFEIVYDVCLQLLEVLDFLHRQNIFHKDVKPANLKLTADGQLKLLDFGLAKGSVGLMSEHNLTLFKGGTPAYISPEQEAAEPTDARTDLYSTAAALFHLASGKIPPKCNVRLHYAASHKADPLRLVSDLEPEIPVWFAQSLHEALALSPDDRPASAAAMADTIKQRQIDSVKSVGGSPETIIPKGIYGKIRDATNDIQNQNSQADILQALVKHAGDFAARGGLFIVKNEHFVGWRGFGDEGAPDELLREIFLPIHFPTLLGNAIEQKTKQFDTNGGNAENFRFLAALNYGNPNKMIAVPLVVRGRGVAVLYADSGANNSPIEDEALEIFVKTAAATIEIWASKVSAVK